MKYLLILKPGDEIIQSIVSFVAREKIDNAYFFGIGAAKYIELAYYTIQEKEYVSKVVEEVEITSLSGNAFLFEDKPIVHAHINVSDKKFDSFGGHLNKGIISVTCEIILEKLNSKIERKFSEEFKLKLI